MVSTVVPKVDKATAYYSFFITKVDIIKKINILQFLEKGKGEKGGAFCLSDERIERFIYPSTKCNSGNKKI